MGSLSMYCNHICLIQRNYSATKTQRHKGNKNIAISHSYLKKCITRKSSTIILNNLGALVARYLKS